VSCRKVARWPNIIEILVEICMNRVKRDTFYDDRVNCRQYVVRHALGGATDGCNVATVDSGY